MTLYKDGRFFQVWEEKEPDGANGIFKLDTEVIFLESRCSLTRSAGGQAARRQNRSQTFAQLPALTGNGAPPAGARSSPPGRPSLSLGHSRLLGPCPAPTSPSGGSRAHGSPQPLCFPGSQPCAPGAHGQMPSVPQLPSPPGPSSAFPFPLPGFTTVLPAHSGASCRAEEGSSVLLKGDRTLPSLSAHHLLGPVPAQQDASSVPKRTGSGDTRVPG